MNERQDLVGSMKSAAWLLPPLLGFPAVFIWLEKTHLNDEVLTHNPQIIWMIFGSVVISMALVVMMIYGFVGGRKQSSFVNRHVFLISVIYITGFVNFGLEFTTNQSLLHWMARGYNAAKISTNTGNNNVVPQAKIARSPRWQMVDRPVDPATGKEWVHGLLLDINITDPKKESFRAIVNNPPELGGQCIFKTESSTNGLRGIWYDNAHQHTAGYFKIIKAPEDGDSDGPWYQGKIGGNINDPDLMPITFWIIDSSTPEGEAKLGELLASMRN